MNTLKPDTKAKLLACCTVLCWSTVATAFKIGLDGIAPLLFLCYVIFFSLLFFIIYLTITQKWKLFKIATKKEIYIAIVSGLLNPFAYYAVLFVAYSRLPAQVAQSLNYVWPIALVVISAFVQKRKISGNVYIGLSVGFAGVVLIASRGNFFSFSFDLLGIICALFSSIIWASYWLIGKASKMNPTVFLFINQAVGFICTLIVVNLFGYSVFSLSTKSLLAALYSGWFEMGITFVLWITALRLASVPEKISHYIFLSPFISLFFIRFFLKEEIYFTTFIGLFLIVAGIFFSERGINILKRFTK